MESFLKWPKARISKGFRIVTWLGSVVGEVALEATETKYARSGNIVDLLAGVDERMFSAH